MESFNEQSKYISILNRIKKKFSTYECLLIMKKQNFTNSTFYYFLCILFRFFYLIQSCGNYQKGIQSRIYLKKLTLLDCFQTFHISFLVYISIIIVIIILLIIRLIMYYYIIKNFNKNDQPNKWTLPNKYLIVIEHLSFLFFPYLIELFSFPYYILFFPNKFYSSITNKPIYLLIIIIVVCTILIIIYNIDNYIGILCTNKKYTPTIFETYSNKKAQKIVNNKPVVYQCSIYNIIILVILQNLVILLMMEDFINIRVKEIFKINVSIIFLLLLIIFFYIRINEFSYVNFINTTLHVFLFYCFYSIIIDYILFALGYTISNIFNDIFYILIKLVLSYISFHLSIMKSISFLESKILDIFFKDNANLKERNLINCLYILHNKIVAIKENSKNTAFLFTKVLTNHINKCTKAVCDCKLLDSLLNQEKKIKLNDQEMSIYIDELLIILNYLFECSFVNYDFYNNYNMCILLAEHYCHCRDNPIMAFSIINTFILRRNNKFSKFEIVELYELSQKYIYHISCKNYINIEKDIETNNKELLAKKQKYEELKKVFHNLQNIYKAKGYICDYIYNEIKILKYKYVFEDSLSFSFDESNEKITSVKINFFEQNFKFDNIYETNNKTKKNTISHKSNLYNVIYLIKKDQFFYQKIINTIALIDINKDFPIDIIIKYILFFDIFEGGKIPTILKEKFLKLIGNNSNLYNDYISKKEYNLLTKRYLEQNNTKDSKIYIIIDLKKELLTKYFSENGALKLGFEQKDIINEKIEKLMPVDFYKSHENLLKHLVINQQSNYSVTKKSFLFDKTRTVLYPVFFDISFIYNLKKSLLFIIESKFSYEKNYTFLLNNNCELLANSKNFEEEYFLNQNILQIYNINLLTMLKLKLETLNKIYKNELNYIRYQKIIRQIRTEEYFINQLFIPNNEKSSVSIFNPNFFKTMKNSVLSKILNKKENGNTDDIKEDDNEKKEILEKNKINNSISELLMKPSKIILKKNHKTSIRKEDFMENIDKELSKIPDNDLMLEKDNINSKLIISAKQLMHKLLSNKDFANERMKIDIKFSFYYDRYYYFIFLEDDNKYLKMSKSIRSTNINNYEKKTSNKSIDYKKKIPYNKKSSKSSKSMSRNKIQIVDINSKNYLIDNNKELKAKNNDNEILEKINEERKKINRDFFNQIIKWVLSIIVAIILIIYVIIIFYQKHILNMSKKMLFAYFHNAHIRQILLYAHSRTIQVFYDYYNLTDNKILTPQEYQNILKGEAETIKENYHQFANYYLEYNSQLNGNYHVLFHKRDYKKIRGFWKEETFNSDYSTEIGFIIYLMYSLDVTNKTEENLIKDMGNFIYFRGKETKEKANTYFIQLLYYMCANYEFIYKDLFIDIENDIFNSYQLLMKKNDVVYISLEVLGLLLYFINGIFVSYYLYFANSVIIKNVIFLFLDYSEENTKKNNNLNEVNIQKLMELKYLIDDFNMNKIDNFSSNIDKLNMNKSLNESDIISENCEKISSKKTKFKIPETSKFKKLSSKMDNDDLIHSLSKKITKNNSSLNYLVESSSQLDKLSQNSLNLSKDLLGDKNKKENFNFNNNNSKSEELGKQDNYQDIILNKSNKSIVLLIKTYFLFMLLLFLIIMMFIIYKIQYSMNGNSKFKNFFSDFTAITNRYAILYYYFNAIRTLIIYPDDERKKIYEKVMEGLDNYYETENKKYLKVLSTDIKTYSKILDLFNLLTQSKEGLEQEYKEKVCGTIQGCINYIDSELNIFTSGIDFGFKSCLKDVNNIYMDYLKLTDKMNFTEVNSTIINSEHSRFVLLGVGLGSCIMYVINKIFDLFKIDVTNFNESFISDTELLNIVSIIFAVLTFLFVLIFIIISITNYIRPIKEATYRINCSFFYIKKFSMTNKNRIDNK